MRFYFDLETTGHQGVGYFSSEQRIIQLGLVADDGWSFVSYINPGMPIHPNSTAIHGITDNHVQNASGIHTLWIDLTVMILSGYPNQEHVFIAHNCFGFDQLVLEKELANVGLNTSMVTAFHDTEPAFRHAFPNLQSHSLKGMVKHFMPQYCFRAHDALEDARALQALCHCTKVEALSFVRSHKRKELRSVWPLKAYITYIRSSLGIVDDIEVFCSYFGNDMALMVKWFQKTPALSELTPDTIAYILLRSFYIEPACFIHNILPRLETLL